MAKPVSWFVKWARRHEALYPRQDWPEPSSEWWAILRRLFDSHSVTEAEAIEASEGLFLEESLYLDAHPRALMKAILAARRAAAARSVPRPMPERRDDGDWNARADANWASLLDGEKDRWRDVVARHLPWGKGHHINESIAKAAAFDPREIEDMSTLEEVPDWGPGHVLGEKKRRERKANEELGRALRFLVNTFAVNATPLRKILEVANEVEISHSAIHEAAKKLNVIKTLGGGGGEEVWDLDQGGKR